MFIMIAEAQLAGGSTERNVKFKLSPLCNDGMDRLNHAFSEVLQVSIGIGNKKELTTGRL